MKLTKQEQALFDTLKQNASGVHQLDLCEAVASNKSNASNGANLVAVHIRNLRKKIAETHTIETMRGFGYRLVPKSKD